MFILKINRQQKLVKYANADVISKNILKTVFIIENYIYIAFYIKK